MSERQTSNFHPGDNRAELQQMRGIVNSLVNIVMEMEGYEEEFEGLVPAQLLDNCEMYN